MGCDIHSVAERFDGNKWRGIDTFFRDPYNKENFVRRGPFDWRNYGMFAFLAGVRNYSDVTPIDAPRGVPDDVSGTADDKIVSWGDDGHSHSWLLLQELLDFDYDQMMEDRRVTRELAPGFISGGCTAEPGEGEQMTWREFLGEQFFEDLSWMKDDGVERIVFWFDN